MCTSLSVTSGLSPPTIVSNEEEFVLQPHSVFNISCTGKRNVVWAEPLPSNTFVLPGYYTATLFIYNATVDNTAYYMCTYESTEEGEPEEDHEAEIYVFVPGETRFSFKWRREKTGSERRNGSPPPLSRCSKEMCFGIFTCFI